MRSYVGFTTIHTLITIGRELPAMAGAQWPDMQATLSRLRSNWFAANDDTARLTIVQHIEETLATCDAVQRRYNTQRYRLDQELAEQEKKAYNEEPVDLSAQAARPNDYLAQMRNALLFDEGTTPSEISDKCLHFWCKVVPDDLKPHLNDPFNHLLDAIDRQDTGEYQTRIEEIESLANQLWKH